MAKVGYQEDFSNLTRRHDVYPAIDPNIHYEAQTYKDKVVFITGASRGIGEETAVQYARAGASLALVGRKQATLDLVKITILKEVPQAKILTFPVDVTNTQAIAQAIQTTVDQLGRLDILVANAGQVRTVEKPFAQQDPDGWWNVIEVNIRGVYNAVHFAIPHLQKTNGYSVIVTSLGANLRIPFASDYCVSKHALIRFVEFIVLENPNIKAFALHPGAILTQLAGESQLTFSVTDTLALPAATMLHLTAGKADWLSGRYVSSTWDLSEVERDWKTKIEEQNGLVSKLYIPQ